MKILYISFDPPYFPGGTGGETRQYHLVRELAVHHEFHYVGPRYEGVRLQILEQFFRRLIMPPPRTFVERVSAFVVKRLDFRYPKLVQQYEWLRMTLMPLIREALATEQYDLIHVEHTNIAHWLHELDSEVPKILSSENVKTIIWERYYRHAKWFERQRFYRDFLRFREYESTYLRDYDCVIAVSERDRNTFREFTQDSVPLLVVPNGCDTDYFRPTETVSDHFELVFTGTMQYRPNAEAMIFFCREIFPRIQAIAPRCRLKIVGNKPPPEVKALEKQGNIEVTGFVPDVRPYLAAAAVVVVPLLSGSGTRLKILEAMAMGKTVVATTVGAEGIDYINGRDIVIADEPESFAENVMALLADGSKREMLGKSARALVEQKYSWQTSAVDLEKAYRFVADKSGRELSGETLRRKDF
jgi:sugar transferase (PEP-CTERM/EpsH1 system associated)